MNKLDYDVVICGAGPTGATASLFLSQSGIRHLIIDQYVFPRPKICGDSITPLCFTILQQVIPDIQNHFAEKLQVKKIDKIRVYSFNQKFADLNLSDLLAEEKNLFYTVSRFVLDDFLVHQVRQRPEAIIWENSKLEDFNVSGDGVTLQILKEDHPIQISCLSAVPVARASMPLNLERLAVESGWIRLLHYEPDRGVASGWRSAIHSPEFFLAASGATDPLAELQDPRRHVGASRQ